MNLKDATDFRKFSPIFKDTLKFLHEEGLLGQAIFYSGDFRAMANAEPINSLELSRLGMCFIWQETDEGHNFWYRVDSSLEAYLQDIYGEQKGD